MNCDSGSPWGKPRRKEILYELRFGVRLRQPQGNALAQRNDIRIAISKTKLMVFVKKSCTRSPEKAESDKFWTAADAKILYTFGDFGVKFGYFRDSNDKTPAKKKLQQQVFRRRGSHFT